MKDLNELRELLVAARAAAAAPLLGNPSWEALQRLRKPADVASAAAQPAAPASPLQAVGAEQAAVALDQTLSKDAVYQLVGKIDEALALIAGMAGADASRFSQQAPVPSAAAVREDDLTRIRGIRPPLAADLNLIGVQNYRQIGTWTAADVRRVSEALALGSTIHQQGWIEQAAMLDAKRAPAAAVARPAVAVSGAPAAGAADHAGATAAGIGGLISGALAGIIAKVPASPAQSQPPSPAAAAGANQEAPSAGPRPFDVAAAASVPSRPAVAVESTATGAAVAAAVVSAARTAGSSSADTSPVVKSPADTSPIDTGPVDTGSVVKSPAVSAPVVAAAAEAQRGAVRAEPAAPVGPPDDLEAIRGIDAGTARALLRQGVRRYADIARMSAADVVACEVRLLQPLRIRREGWVEQAALLARGELTAFERQRRAGLLLPLAQPDSAKWTARLPAGGTQPKPSTAAAPMAAAAAVAEPARARDTDPATGSAVAGASPAPTMPSAAPGAVAASDTPAAASPTAGSGQPPAVAVAVPVVASVVAAPAVPTPAVVAVPARVVPTVPLPAPRVPVLDQISTIRPAKLLAAVAPSPPPEQLLTPKPPRLADLSERERRRLERAGEALAPGMAASLAAAAAAGLTLSEAEGMAGGVNRRRTLAEAVTPLAPRASTVNLRQWQSDSAREAVEFPDARPPALPAAQSAASDAVSPATEDDSFLDPAGEAEVVIVAKGNPPGGQLSEVRPAHAPTAPVVSTPADSIRARLARRGTTDPDTDDNEARAALEEASVEIVVDGMPVRPPEAPADQAKEGGFRRLVKALTSDTKPRS